MDYADRCQDCIGSLALFAIGLLCGAIILFHDASQNGSSALAHPNAAEDQPHGIDALSGVLSVYLGLIELIISIVLFIIAATMFFVSSSKLKKKAADTRQQVSGQAVVSAAPQTNAHEPVGLKQASTTDPAPKIK